MSTTSTKGVENIPGTWTFTILALAAKLMVSRSALFHALHSHSFSFTCVRDKFVRKFDVASPGVGDEPHVLQDGCVLASRTYTNLCENHQSRETGWHSYVS